jgi:hypothetical protein
MCWTLGCIWGKRRRLNVYLYMFHWVFCPELHSTLMQTFAGTPYILCGKGISYAPATTQERHATITVSFIITILSTAALLYPLATGSNCWWLEIHIIQMLEEVPRLRLEHLIHPSQADFLMMKTPTSMPLVGPRTAYSRCTTPSRTS